MTRDDRSLPLAGKVAVVTGAARGLGRAAAVALAAAGADVVGVDVADTVTPILDFDPATVGELDATGRAVTDMGGRWEAIRLDQRDRGAVRAAATEVTRIFGGLDILFANAGIQGFRSILEMEDADWDDQIDVNLTGAANVLRAFAPLLVRRGGGRIIVTSSTQGQHGALHGAAYSASKWGLIGLAKSAALDLGPSGVTVNILVPGLLDTAMTRHEERYAQAIAVAGRRPSGDAEADEAAAKEILSRKSPLGTPWIDAADVAPMVVFLASDAARMCTGATFSVTAGDSANMVG